MVIVLEKSYFDSFFFFLRENQSKVVTAVDYTVHPTGLGMGDILNGRRGPYVPGVYRSHSVDI